MNYGIQRAYIDGIKNKCKVESSCKYKIYCIRIYYENSWDEWIEHMLNCRWEEYRQRYVAI